MLILIVMFAGVIAGRFLVPEKAKRANEYLQIVCTAVMIFAMGISLGQKDHFFRELLSLGGDSLLFFAVPTACSILLVYLLTKRFFVREKNSIREGRQKKR
nr:LysO family transporter [uncultured Acetatifactor sp.]